MFAISLLVIQSCLLLPAESKAQELFKVNLPGDSLYRATKDVPFAFQVNNNTVYLEYSNMTRENVAMSIDTFILRTCLKFFKATLADGRTIAINKDFVRRIQTRTGNKSYVYMIHTPTRYDLNESLPTIISRLALCQGGSESLSSSLYVSGDSVCITGGNCVYLPSAFPYSAGAGIDITGNVITNIGDPNPNDDVLKTTNHDGDVTGLYNALTVKNGVIGVEKLDSAAVLTWVNGNIDVDTSNFNLNELESWLYTKVDTIDTDSQSMYILSDTLWITRGNGIPLDSIRGDAMPSGQRGETLWRDSTGWVVDSTLFNDGQRIGITTDTLYNANLTIGTDNDSIAIAVISDTAQLYIMPGSIVYNPQLLFKAYGDTTDTEIELYVDSVGRVNLKNQALGMSGEWDHTSGVQYMADFGTDLDGNRAVFNAQSGNGNFSFLRVSGEVDADSAAFGQVSGILIQPVLTSLPQNLGTAYRAIDIASSGGIGIYQSGSLVENRIRGNTMIGSTGRPLQTLDVSGTMRLRGSLTGNNGLLGVKLSNGDVGYVRLGSGLVMSNDSLRINYEFPADSTLWIVDDGMKSSPIKYKSTLNMVGTGTVSVTLDTATNTLTFNGAAADTLGNTLGEANVGMNVGAGAQVYKAKMDTTLLFRTLVDEGLTTVTQAGDTIVINTPAQSADTFRVNGNNVELSLSNDGQGVKTIPIKNIIGDGTDNYYAVFSTADTLRAGVLKDTTGQAIFYGNAGFGFYNSEVKLGAGSITGSAFQTIGRAIRFQAQAVNNVGLEPHYFQFVLNGNYQPTNNLYVAALIKGESVFNPTSGGASFSTFFDNMVVSQGGTASGITRSFYARPTLTNAVDHRSFDTGTNGKIAFSSTGTSDSRHAGSFRIGQHAAPVRTLDVTGTLRASANVDTASLTRIWAGNTQGDLRRLKLGTNLSISNDTLNASGGGGGGGIGFSDYNPTLFVGTRTAKDSLTEIKRDELEYDDNNGIAGYYPLANVRIKNDTVVTIRGSHFDYYENVARTKVLGATTTDTLDVDNLNAKFDWVTTGNGRFTLDNAPDEVPAPGFDGFAKLFVLSATISVSADSIVDTEFSIYVNGGQIASSVAEFTVDGSKRATINIECQEWLFDGQYIDVRLRNTSANSRTYTIERVRFGAHHIKSAYIINQ